MTRFEHDGLHTCSSCGQFTWSKGNLCHECQAQHEVLSKRSGSISPAWFDWSLVTAGVICAIVVGVLLTDWCVSCARIWLGAAR